VLKNSIQLNIAGSSLCKKYVEPVEGIYTAHTGYIEIMHSDKWNGLKMFDSWPDT